jgi:hypothetical protein
MSTNQILTQGPRITAVLKDQLGVLAILLALLLLTPLALEHASVPTRLGVAVVILPIVAIWYGSTALPPSYSNTTNIQPAQWARWAQYITVVFGMIYAQHIMAN